MNRISASGQVLKVGIVDSGIDANNPAVNGVVGGVSITFEEKYGLSFGADYSDNTGHGTACAAIICSKVPQVELYSIRIFQDALLTHANVLVAALQWAIDQEMDLLNISLGTMDFNARQSVQKMCIKALKGGMIVVAAAHSTRRFSFPAALPEVIGVASGKITGEYEYEYHKGAIIECFAKGGMQRLSGLKGNKMLGYGSSYAAPRISAIVAELLRTSPQLSLKEIRQKLEDNASHKSKEIIRTEKQRQVSRPLRNLSVSSIKKAALYPFNKEMHGFIRFPELIDFQVVGIADPAGKGLVGKDAGIVLGLEAMGVCISGRLEDVLTNADTLIIGYVDILGQISKKDVLHECIYKAIQYGVHIFSFLSVEPAQYPDLYAAAQAKGVQITYPGIVQDEIQYALGQAYDEVDVPVLGVIGTSASQGKFTLQLALRNQLKKMGYNVGQIGTEHHAALFGMDYTFPMGYASPLTFPVQWYVPLLGHKMAAIARQDKDIILVGTQSGTIPYDLFEPSTHTLSTLAFLMSTKPDACILVVNTLDPDTYIWDTIKAMQTMLKMPTLLLAVSDKEKQIHAAYGQSVVKTRQRSKVEMAAVLKRLEHTFDLPACTIGKMAGQQKMAELVVGYFTQNSGDSS